MFTQLFLILITACITSAATIGATWYLYQNYLKEQLDAAIDEKAQSISVMLDEKAQNLGAILQDRVREGVREGMDEGLTELRTGLVQKVTKSAAKTGMDMLDDNFNMLFGSSKSRRKKENEDNDDF